MDPLRRHACARSCVALAALWLCACAARRPAPAPAPADTREGRTSVRLLNVEVGGSGSPDPAAERITPVYPSVDNKPPEYPAYALKAGCRDGSVPVRVFIGVDGNVANQRDVPDRPLPDDACHVAFRAAVQAAVAAWRFAPAFRLTPQPGPDRDGDGRPDFTGWKQTPIMIYLDYEFLFKVVEGKGVVQSR
jgi:hypothetical protein